MTSTSWAHQLPASSWRNHRAETKEAEEGFERLRVASPIHFVLNEETFDLRERSFQVIQKNASGASPVSKVFCLPVQLSDYILLPWEGTWRGTGPGETAGWVARSWCSTWKARQSLSIVLWSSRDDMYQAREEPLSLISQLLQLRRPEVTRTHPWYERYWFPHSGIFKAFIPNLCSSWLPYCWRTCSPDTEYPWFSPLYLEGKYFLLLFRGFVFPYCSTREEKDQCPKWHWRGKAV